MGVQEPLPESYGLSRVPLMTLTTFRWTDIVSKEIAYLCVKGEISPTFFLRKGGERDIIVWWHHAKINLHFELALEEVCLNLEESYEKLWVTLYKKQVEKLGTRIWCCSMCKWALFRGLCCLGNTHTNTHVQTWRGAAVWILPSVSGTSWQLMPHFCRNFQGLGFE